MGKREYVLYDPVNDTILGLITITRSEAREANRLLGKRGPPYYWMLRSALRILRSAEA